MANETNRIGIDRRPPTWVLLVLSGLILGLAYPPNPVGLLGSIGLVPLLLASERAASWRQLFRWSYLSFLLFSALSTWWVGSWQPNADPFLMISAIALIVVQPLFFVVPMLVYRWVRQRTSLYFGLALLPFLWCGGEFLHALGDASYPWLTLGNTQTYNLYFIQFIEFTGVWGLSFVLLVHNVAFAAMIFALDHTERDQRRVFSISAILLAVTLVPPFLYGFYVLDKGNNHVAERSVVVTVVQPNVNPWDKWRAADTTDHIALNTRLSKQGGSEEVDMYLWSENAIPYPITSPEYGARRAQMDSALQELGVPVLTGFPDYKVYPSSEAAPPSRKISVVAGDTIYWDYYNSAGMFVPGRGLTDVYHKMQLVPFGERIPFVDAVPGLMKLLSWDVGISTWAQGDSATTLELPLRNGGVTRTATPICFESIYPNVVRRFVANGAEFLTVITNDGWYLNTPGPLQHARFALLRCVENRRALARSANTGISCFIDPYGRISHATEQGVATTITSRLELRRDTTLYTKFGDWWPIFCLIVALSMIATAALRGMRGANTHEA